MISADKTKALVCTINSPAHQQSYMQKLFGDPDQYAYKFGNSTFADKLPIQLNVMSVERYDFFHAVSVDYNTQWVYYSNNDQKQLNRGLYIYNNDTQYKYFYAVPETSQVTVANVYRAYTNAFFVVLCILHMINSAARHRNEQINGRTDSMR